MSQPKLTFHHLSNSRSLRVVWLLEELGLQYDLRLHERGEGGAGPQELKDAHPLGTSPLLIIEENGKTVKIPESGAIVEYLCNRFGKSQFVPDSSNTEHTADYLTYVHFAEGSIMTPLVEMLLFKTMPYQTLSWLSALTKPAVNMIIDSFIAPTLKRDLTWLESQIKAAGGQYFVGQKLTGADVMLTMPVDLARPLPNFKKDYPALDSWLEALQHRPAYQTATRKTGGDKVDFGAVLNG